MKSAGGSITFLSVILVLLIRRYVNSDIIIKPSDAEALVGGTAFFNCSTTLTSAEIHWFHYAIGDTKDRSFVYGYDQFYSSYIGRFQMEKNAETGSYNLIITSVTVDDAGRYECQDDSGRGDKDSAQLTVLDANPVCQSNIKPQGLIGPNICGFEPDTLHLTCSVQYYGNQPPMMQWRKVGSNSPIEEGITHNASSDRAIYYLKMEVNSGMHGSSYQCVTTRSTAMQHVCTSEVVNVKSFSGTYIFIAFVLASLGLAIVSAIAGFKAGEHYMKKRVSRKDCSHLQLTAPKEPEYMELIDQSEKLTAENRSLLAKHSSDKETMEKLTAKNEGLLEKVNELEQQLFCSDNKAKQSASNLVHTIATKAGKKPSEPTPIAGVKTPITGMAILDSNLFVVKKNYPVVEVYDSETFVFVRLIENLRPSGFTNPLDITSSKENNKFLYTISRENDESTSIILKFNTAGEGCKMWPTENDDGRLSTYKSNIIVCFSTKRIIIEYTPEGQTVNVVRLSPGNGFNNLWHAVKLTGTHFMVSHSMVEDGQRVCVVDMSGSVLAALEKLPALSKNILSRDHFPICLVGQRDDFVLVADARNKRVLLLSPKELEYEDVLIVTYNHFFQVKTDEHRPVRLCLNDTKDRLFVGVNSGEYAKPETWKEGCILIYNLSK